MSGKRYALVTVSNGVACVEYEDPGVEVFVLDWDAIDDGPVEGVQWAIERIYNACKKLLEVAEVQDALKELEHILDEKEGDDRGAADPATVRDLVDSVDPSTRNETLVVTRQAHTSQGDVTHTATLVKTLDGWAAERALYYVSPPMTGEVWAYSDNGEYECREVEYPYIVVSAVVAPSSGPETYIFGATEEGYIANWSELKGPFNGALNHAAALSNAGYTIVKG